ALRGERGRRRLRRDGGGLRGDVSMMRRYALVSGCAVLAMCWVGPLARLAHTSFSIHMTIHMGVVAVAAPLLALGVAGGRFDPVRRHPVLFAPIPASMVELAVVW